MNRNKIVKMSDVKYYFIYNNKKYERVKIEKSECTGCCFYTYGYNSSCQLNSSEISCIENSDIKNIHYIFKEVKE